jgi:hypothetical protein
MTSVQAELKYPAGVPLRTPTSPTTTTTASAEAAAAGTPGCGARKSSVLERRSTFEPKEVGSEMQICRFIN